MTNTKANESGTNSRNETIKWLQENGYPVLPVAPAQDANKYPKLRKDTREIELDKDGNPQSLFTGKNPSYLDKDGKPHLIYHSNYQEQLPTEDELNKWFLHPDTGVGTLGDWNNTIWLDVDVKNFDSPEDCNNAVDNLLKDHPKLQETFTERTHSGGYRIGVKVKQSPDFKNFTLQLNGKHVGEALGKGSFTVLAPTVGVPGNTYQNIKRVPLVEVDSLESIGIYPVRKKKEETNTKKETKRDPQPANKSGIKLELLGSETSQSILKGQADNNDRSEALTTAIKEWFGWENWCNENGIDYNGTTEELAKEAGNQLGTDSDKIQRILDSVDSDDCHPAALFMGDGSNCWLKVRKLDKKVYEANCPDGIKQEIEQQNKSNSSQEYVSVMNEMERILQIEDPGLQKWDLEQLSKQTKIKTSKLVEIYTAKSTASQTFAPIDIHDFLANNPDEREWLIAAHISLATTVLLYADGGVGKTLLAYALVKAVATGEAWNGFITKQGQVLIIQTDEPEVDTSERLNIAGFKDIPKGVVTIETNWQFSQIRQLKQWIERERPLFVVIDSLTSANRNSGVEEKDTSYGSVLYELRDIANEFKCSIMVLHHENKAGGTRGTTAICDNVSEVWRLRKGEAEENLSDTQRVLEISKSRSGCTGKHQIDLDTDNYSWKHQGKFGEPENAPKSLKDKLLGFLEDQPGRKYKVKELATELNSNEETVRNNLNKLCQKGQINREEAKADTPGGKQKVTLYFAPHLLTSMEPLPEMQS
ncbi:AAA family ATPase [Anabaena sp. UHCC 0253]|uniref:AAA family ATPase n=1 Tax=Anabaena sp. UHCC 0253 TaxID=2590019 RepID=UPI001C2C5353|nr:AAA family ATPase [Anabaena sp. UHCC 0253]